MSFGKQKQIGRQTGRIDLQARLIKQDVLVPVPAKELAKIRADLQARQELAILLSRQKVKRRTTGEAIAKGLVGTREAMGRMQDIHLIAGSPRNPNCRLAGDIELIFRHLRNNSFDVIGEDSQALVNAANKVAKFGQTKRPIILTKRESAAIKFYLNYARAGKLQKNSP